MSSTSPGPVRSRAHAAVLVCAMAIAAAWVAVPVWSTHRPATAQVVTTPTTNAPATTEPVTAPPSTAPATTRSTIPRTTIRRPTTTRGPSTTPPSTAPTTVAGTLPPTSAGNAPVPSTLAAGETRPGEGKMPAWPLMLSGVGVVGAAGILTGQWMRTRG